MRQFVLMSLCLIVLGLNLTSSVPTTYAGVPCSTPILLFGSTSPSGSASGCYLAPIGADTSFLRLSLTSTGNATYDLYHTETQVSYLSDWDKLNDSGVSGEVNYAFVEPAQGNHTIAVMRTGGTGNFTLRWEAVGAASLASSQPINTCEGDVCTSAIPLVVSSGIMVGADFGDRVIFPLEIGKPGRITVRAEWKGAASLALILNGPDRPEQLNPSAYYERRDGGSPLTLTYNVSQEDFNRGRKWRISLVNFSGGQAAAQGNIRIDYPASTIRDHLKRSVTRADFVGNWTNVDDKTGGLTRISIDEDGQNVKVHTWGACVPQDCDHGITTVRFQGNPVEVRRDFGFKGEVLTLWRLENGELRVLSDNNFDDPNRRDYVSEYRFRRVFQLFPLPITPIDPGRLLPIQPLPGPSLLAKAEERQVIQFNPNAALQKRIFAEGFVPNSAEFSLVFQGVSYTAQRAERLDTGVVRVYYVRVGDWGNVQIVQRPNPTGSALGAALLDEGQRKQVIQFNPDAALQKRIFADRFVPNSAEFNHNVGPVAYVGQRAEHLGTGQVRVYFVRSGDWTNVQIYNRP